jgi:type VI secretion system protein ImpB
MELPFVVGILADLSGNVSDPNRVPLRDRKYIELDRDNFNEVMKSIGPKVEINGSSKQLAFEKLDDFSPIRVLEQIDLKDRFDKRTRLSDVVAKLDGNVKLQQKFLEVLTDDAKRNELKTKIDELKGMLTPPADPNAEKPVNEGGNQ